MHDPAHAAYRADEIRAVESRAGVSVDELMQRAGSAAYRVLRARWPGARRVAVVAGPGNNGGDARVVAGLAEGDGLEATVLTAESRRIASLPQASLPHDGFDVVVDGLFGSGLNRAPSGEAARLIDWMNAQPAPVLALDLPSGIRADDGVAPGAAVRAAATAVFVAYKRGLFTADAPLCAGELVLATLDVPDTAFAGLVPAATALPAGAATRALGRRARDAHKGRHGHVLVIGGRPGFAGAARLAAEAALRCGAGLVSVAVAPGAGAAVAAERPELMVRECADATELAPLFERATVVAVGPGLGTDAWAQACVDAAFACGLPLVVDADALNLLASKAHSRGDWILTPHPGEASRLLACDAGTIQRDRYAALAALAADGGTIVLKGAYTLVGARGRVPAVCIAANPALAVGGTGDVLTGVIAALRAQGADAVTAAGAGVRLHADAGAAAAAARGERGMLASDLFEHLQRGVNA